MAGLGIRVSGWYRSTPKDYGWGGLRKSGLVVSRRGSDVVPPAESNEGKMCINVLESLQNQMESSPLSERRRAGGGIFLTKREGKRTSRQLFPHPCLLLHLPLARLSSDGTLTED